MARNSEEMKCTFKKLIFEVCQDSVENLLLCTMRKTKFIPNGILFDVPLNSHVDIQGNLLQPVRRVRISASKSDSTYNRCCIDRTSHRSFAWLHRYKIDHMAAQDGHTECSYKHVQRYCLESEEDTRVNHLFWQKGRKMNDANTKPIVKGSISSSPCMIVQGRVVLKRTTDDD